MAGFVSFVLNCETTDELSKSERYSDTVNKKSPSRREIEKIKECNIKLDKCLKSCDSEYPDLSTVRPNRGKCRDSCVASVEHLDGCIIHYQTFRSDRYRGWIRP